AAEEGGNTGLVALPVPIERAVTVLLGEFGQHGVSAAFGHTSYDGQAVSEEAKQTHVKGDAAFDRLPMGLQGVSLVVQVVVGYRAVLVVLHVEVAKGEPVPLGASLPAHAEVPVVVRQVLIGGGAHLLSAAH